MAIRLLLPRLSLRSRGLFASLCAGLIALSLPNIADAAVCTGAQLAQGKVTRYQVKGLSYSSGGRGTGWRTCAIGSQHVSATAVGLACFASSFSWSCAAPYMGCHAEANGPPVGVSSGRRQYYNETLPKRPPATGDPLESEAFGVASYDIVCVGEPTATPTPTPAPCPTGEVDAVIAATYAGSNVQAMSAVRLCSQSGEGVTEDCSIKPADVSLSSGNIMIGHWEWTGESCEPDDSDGDEVEVTPQTQGDGTEAQCASAGGRTVCIEDGTQCGYYNGERVCIAAVEDGQCVDTPSGGRMCATNAGTPPAPDAGTPGVPAQPDAQIGGKPAGGNQTTNNYYSSDTVNNSSDDDDGGDDGNGDCEGDEPCGEPGDCPEGETCTGSFRGPGGTAKTFTETLTDFRAAIQQSPLMIAVNATTGGMGVGTCPPLQFTVPGWGTIGTAIHCEIANDSFGILGPLMLGIWGFLGLRIIVSA